MREVIVRPATEVDIEDAGDYTIEQWGREQAQYIGDIRKAIERLAVDGMPSRSGGWLSGPKKDAERASLHILSDRRRERGCRPRDA